LGDWRNRAGNDPNFRSVGVNKHYDLVDAADLEDVLSELIGLIRDGSLPPDAVTYTTP
jgi:hypothetical protein